MTNDFAPRRAALAAGAGYLIIFLFALFANFVVIEGLVESGDAAATAANITDSEGLFRLGIVAFTVIFVVDVVIAWALWILFRSVARDVSLLAGWLRLTYTVMLGVAIVFLFSALQMLTTGVLDGADADAHALLAVDAFEYAWLIGLVAFGGHLITLGWLVIRSGWATRILGYVLMVAGTAYVADTLARALIADYASVENLFLAIVAIPSVIGELWFTIWLLTRAGKEQAAVPAAA